MAVTLFAWCLSTGMGRISAMSIVAILLLSIASFPVSDNQSELHDFESSASSSQFDCTNQTHSAGSPFHVDNQLGNDSYPGTINCPLETISHA